MSGSTLRLLRQVHNYLGAFFAPAIIFLAFSGALQTFGLHENRGGSDYDPPAWIVAIASIHKDQALPRAGSPHDHDHDDDHHPPSGEAHGGDAGSAPSPLPLKLFVLCLATGLIISTLLGLTVALNNPASRRWTAIMLGLGFITPIALLFL